jgi:hypothetical protein
MIINLKLVKFALCSRMNENGEIIAKMLSDNWIVAKVSNRREFYAIFNQKNSNLLEVDGMK